MAFRLPANLGVGQQYVAVSPDASADVDALEASLPSGSRMLVGLTFAERYEGFEEDCVRAEAALQEQSGLLPWSELGYFITPDEDGEPIAWVSYLSSPSFFTIILIILGAIFLLPILSVLPVFIIDLMFPGFVEMIGMVVMIMVVGGIMLFMPKLMPKEKKKEIK